MTPALTKVLIANRGAIARRIVRACDELGIASVVVYSAPDAQAPYLAEAGEAYSLAGHTATETYLDQDQILAIARQSGADAIHPGYGFLSVNPLFSKACLDEGITFVGPSPKTLELFGDKAQARKLAEKNKINLPKGVEVKSKASVKKLTFPIMIKAAFGGGGRGMRLVRKEAELSDAIEAAKREAMLSFGNDTLIAEEYLENARHIEVQIAADDHGNVVHFFERDCSLQRRNQKVLEIAPAPVLADEIKEKLYSDAIKIASAAKLQGLATVEFLISRDVHYFLEVNPRLQVEHPITECICGIDLVELQLQIAQGERIPENLKSIKPQGFAIEARICAENPAKNFAPQIGRILSVDLPKQSKSLRIDHSLNLDNNNSRISPFYDSLIAKAISHDSKYELALDRLKEAISQIQILGIQTNCGFLKDLISSAKNTDNLRTKFIDENLSKLVQTEDEKALAFAAALSLSWIELSNYSENSFKETSLTRINIHCFDFFFFVVLVR